MNGIVWAQWQARNGVWVVHAFKRERDSARPAYGRSWGQPLCNARGPRRTDFVETGLSPVEIERFGCEKCAKMVRS